MSTSNRSAEAYSDLDQGYSRLLRSNRLHGVHWAILALSIGITLLAWYIAGELVNQRLKLRFERQADQVVELITERLRKYEDALWAGAAAMLAHEHDLNREQWRAYAQRLDINNRYPGINGIGVIYDVDPGKLPQFIEQQRLTLPGYTIFPQHAHRMRLPIVLIEPVADNAEAVGLDIAFEDNRREAALAAIHMNTAQITGPIVLVQDEAKTPGFLFMVPFFQSQRVFSQPEGTLSFDGLVYAPFIVNKLAQGALEQDRRQVRIRITDDDTVIYDEITSAGESPDGQARFSRSQTTDLYGRQWRFDIETVPGFVASAGGFQPHLVLIAGLVIDSLLFVIFLLLTRFNRHALAYAKQVTAALDAERGELEKSHNTLEQFTYVVTHDLKSPLCNIRDLAGYLQEDVQTVNQTSESKRLVWLHTTRIVGQADRATALIDSLLTFATKLAWEAKPTSIDTAKLIKGVAVTMELGLDRLSLKGDFPHLLTDEARLVNVFERLLENAVIFHHDPERARIQVSVTPVPNGHRFTIEDDGPGIDSQYHERIFEPFKTLQSKDDVESSGLGLAVVKRTVEALGGSISIDSAPGNGTRISFVWPSSPERATPSAWPDFPARAA